MSDLNYNELLAFYQRLQTDKFHGKVTLQYEDGRVTYIRKEEVIKPNELGKKNGS